MTARPHGRGPNVMICPFCWHVNRHAVRLCARCGADPSLALQESGGLRWTAPIQSPVPVRGSGRLSLWQRVVVGAFVAIIWLSSILGVFSTWAPPPQVRSPQPAAQTAR